MKNVTFLSKTLFIFVCTTSTIAYSPFSLKALGTIQGQRLNHVNITLLNTTFEEYPSSVLRIDLAKKAVEGALRAVESRKQGGEEGFRSLDLNNQEKKEKTDKADKEFARVQLKNILAPVQQFFDALTAYTALVKPLIEQSYFQHNINNGLLVRFFDPNSKMSIKDFCEKEITSSEALEKASNEFLCFFADLNASLSEKAKKRSQELLQQLNNKKKK